MPGPRTETEALAWIQDAMDAGRYIESYHFGAERAPERGISLLDVRGHIPRFDDFRPAPAAPAPAGVMRALAAAIAVCAVLALAIWGLVWLTMHLL